MASSEKSKDTQFNINFGCEILMEIEGTGKRVKSSLIGMAPNSYLIIETPKIVGITEMLSKEASIIIRYTYSGRVYGFRTFVMGNVSSPDKVTFLSYPKTVEKIDLRQYERIDCAIPASLVLAEIDLKGVLSDLSVGGCRFIPKSEKNYEGRPFKIGDTINLSFPLVGMKGNQKIDGIIRNMNYIDNTFSFGIQFDETNFDAIKKIESYIKLVKNVKDE